MEILASTYSYIVVFNPIKERYEIKSNVPNPKKVLASSRSLAEAKGLMFEMEQQNCFDYE
jgi:hypothetical protein